MSHQKLGLGTVQFGLNYGISNTSGKVAVEETINILNLAKKHGIKLLDTAFGYGESEETLGKYNSISDFQIVTKLPPQNSDHGNLRSFFETSLSRLNLPSCYGLLIHHGHEILSNHKLYNELIEIKNSKKVKKIGISVYSPEELMQLIDRFDFDLVQIPLNLFDQRFLRTGMIAELKKRNVEVHARSIFLQGLPLMSKDEIQHLPFGQYTVFKNFFEEIEKLNISPIKFCLDFIQKIDLVDNYLVGVCNSNQLLEIINCLKLPPLDVNFDMYHIDDENIINPSKWFKSKD